MESVEGATAVVVEEEEMVVVVTGMMETAMVEMGVVGKFKIFV